MKIIYILTKNGTLITRAFDKESNARNDCRDKNARTKTNDKYSYIRIAVADS